MDTNGHPLGQADPFEGGVDVGQKIEAGAAIILRDAPADAIDATFQRFVWIGHEGNDGPITHTNVANQRFPEKTLYPITIDIHQSEGWLIGNGLSSDTQMEVGHITIYRRPNLSKFKVQASRFDRRLRGP